jgi:hypothetical protein
MAVKFGTHVEIAISPRELGSMFFPGGPVFVVVKLNLSFHESAARNYQSNQQRCSLDNVAGIVNVLRTGWSGIRIPVGAKVCIFSKMSRPVLGPTLPSVGTDAVSLG